MTTMIKKRVAELEGAQLDWAVATASGYKLVMKSAVYAGEWKTPIGRMIFAPLFKPSTDWKVGGPIIERKGIAMRPHVQENGVITSWRAGFRWPVRDTADVLGDTPLIAAMRAFVASKLGDEVEVPV